MLLVKDPFEWPHVQTLHSFDSASMPNNFISLHCRLQELSGEHGGKNVTLLLVWSESGDSSAGRPHTWPVQRGGAAGGGGAAHPPARQHEHHFTGETEGSQAAFLMVHGLSVSLPSHPRCQRSAVVSCLLRHFCFVSQGGLSH